MLKLVLFEQRTAPAVTLSPAQQRAANCVIGGLERGDCAVLQDRSSDGKTTVLGYVHQHLGGTLIGVREFLVNLRANDPAAIEEAFLDLLDGKMAQHELLIVDDLHLVKNIVESCDYARKSLFDAVLTAALESAAAAPEKVPLCL